MKSETKNILKERGKIELFTDDRYNQVKELMQYSVKKDKWLKMYLSLDPINKAQWNADHLIMLTEDGHI